jgi:hypothetical protein
MSSATFAPESLSSQTLKAGGSTLRVNRPGDAHEVEADHIAERISRGERIASWNLKTASRGGVQRDPQTTPDGQPPPGRQLSAADMAGKAAEALLATKEGKAAIAAIKKDPLVKSTTDFFATPAGIIVGGSAATGVIAGLALEHKALPLQLPKIPLDFVHPGLSMKLSYQGPVDKPTAASLTLSFTPEGPKHKKADAGASIRDEIAQLRAQQQWIQGSMTDAERPGPTAQPGGAKQADPAAAGAAPKAPAAVPTPEAALKSAPKTPDSAKPKEEKRDEAVIQRKAEIADAHAHPVPASIAGVHDTLHGSGRPLDPRTRGYMESRFGVNFSNVRIHTGDRAAQSARSLQARAYTVGTDIVFASGKYAPETASGRRLLAHELTHVVQQSSSTARKAAGISPSPARVQRDGGVRGWIADKLHKIPGYDLFGTIIGKDIATWTDKPSGIKDILHEFLKFVGKEDVWERLSEAAGAIAKAWEWFKSELDARHLTLTDFKALIQQAKDSLHRGDLLDTDGAIERLKGMFRPSYEQAIDLGKLAGKKLLEIIVEFVMETFGDTGKQVMGFLRKAGDTISTIAHDPMKFVGNLVDALKLGFKNFAGKFPKYLKDSLMDFLFDAVGSHITIPKSFSLRSIFNLVLEVLDLNYAAFRERLVTKTSPETVAILEAGFDTITKIANAKSLSGAWDVIWQQAGDLVNTLVDTAIGKIKSWVQTAIVEKAIEQVLKLFTPASAVIAAIEAIYHTIKTLIEKGKQLAAVLTAAVESIARIAAGDVGPAAEKIEAAMANALKFIVAFFAEQAGVGGIGETIRGIIKAIKDKVWGVIDKVIDFVVGKASGLLAKAKESAGKVLAWWQQRKDLMIGGQDHAIYMEGTEDDPHLRIASTPTLWTEYLAEKAKTATGERKKLLEDTDVLVKRLQEKLEKKGINEKSKKTEDKRKIFDQVCKNIGDLGLPGNAVPVSSKPDYGPENEVGATKATVEVLSAVHNPGSAPSKESQTWKDLEPIRSPSKKDYVRGHLLNHNLGGPGVGENLTPITQTANKQHLNDVERDLKRKVLEEKAVVRYQVEAIYTPARSSDAEKPKPMLALEAQEAKQAVAGAALPESDQKRLKAYRAEQKLCHKFAYEWNELDFVTEKNVWVINPKIGGKGTVDNTIDLNK